MIFLTALYILLGATAFTHASLPTMDTEDSPVATLSSIHKMVEEDPDTARTDFEALYGTTYEGSLQGFESLVGFMVDYNLDDTNRDLIQSLTQTLSQADHDDVNLDRLLTQFDPFFNPENPEQTMLALQSLIDFHHAFQGHVQSAMSQAYRWEEDEMGTRLQQHLDGIFPTPLNSAENAEQV